MGVTDDRSDPDLHKTDESGQNVKYLVLSDAERAKGFVRPLRRSYVHSQIPRPNLLRTRDLTPEEHERYDQFGYAKFEEYPPTSDKALGRFWTQAELDKAARGCGVETQMGLALCETYARDPKFYSATFCVGCGAHLPVGQFTWAEDGAVVGS